MTGSVDLEVAQWMADHRSAPVTRVCRFLEHLGESPLFFLALALVGLAVVAVLRLWSGLPAVLAALLVTVVLTGPLKELFDRPRPPPELALTALSEPAMPSSHAILTSSIVVAVVMASWWTSPTARRVFAVLGALGCVVAAAAMIYLGGHWLTDVLVGWALGIGLTAATMWLWQRWGLPGARKPA